MAESSAVVREAKRKRLESLQTDYQAIYKEIDSTRSEVDVGKLKRMAEKIELEMKALEGELGALERKTLEGELGALDMPPAEPGTDRALTVAIGPTKRKDEELAKRANSLTALLTKNGIKCLPITLDLFEEYNPNKPETGESLRDFLQRADWLVVISMEVEPMFSAMVPGGHIGILDKEWRTLNKKRNPIWFKPADLAVPATADLDDEHREAFLRLGDPYKSEDEVLSLIVGYDQNALITLCIQPDNIGKGFFQALETKIEKLWLRLSQNQKEAPMLECAPLYVQDDLFNPDAAGYFLLYQSGVTSKVALESAITSIQKLYRKKGTGAKIASFTRKGRVAVILSQNFPDNAMPQPPTGRWFVVNCCPINDSRPPELAFPEASENDLEIFLKCLLEQHSGTRQPATPS